MHGAGVLPRTGGGEEDDARAFARRIGVPREDTPAAAAQLTQGLSAEAIKAIAGGAETADGAPRA